MNIWKRNRQKLNIPTIEVAKILEIPEEKYLEIERGERPMPRLLIDKFMNLVNKKSETKGDFMIKMLDINLWFKQSDLKQLRVDFGYKTQLELANVLCINNGTVSKIENKILDSVSNKLKLKIYNFFTDELNKKINKSKIKTTTEKIINKNENNRKSRYVPDLNDDILKFTKDGKIDYQYIKDVLEMTSTEISTALGSNTSSLWANWVIGRNNPSKENVNKLRELVREKLTNNQIGVDVNEEIEASIVLDNDSKTSKEMFNNEETETTIEIGNQETTKLTNKDFGIIDEEYIDYLEKENAQLKRTINCYEKLIEKL